MDAEIAELKEELKSGSILAGRRKFCEQRILQLGRLQEQSGRLREQSGRLQEQLQEKELLLLRAQQQPQGNLNYFHLIYLCLPSAIYFLFRCNFLFYN